jgi:hypothetical protein
MGGSDDKMLKHNFHVRNSLAFYNKAKGFDQNNKHGFMQVLIAQDYSMRKRF